MAQLTINTGSNAGAGDGDTLYSAFNKINTNFSELYVQLGSSGSAALKDIKGSVFADDSTVLVDAVNGSLNGNLTGNVTGDVTGTLTGDVTGNITSSGTSTFSGTLDLTSASISSDVNFGDNDLTDINNLTISGSLLTETMSPLLATAGNGQSLTLAGGQSTAGDGGNAIINAGSGTGTNGDVQIGSSNTANVVIGAVVTLPKLSQAQVDALTAVEGMIVYNTTTGKFQGYAGDALGDSVAGWADLHP